LCAWNTAFTGRTGYLTECRREYSGFRQKQGRCEAGLLNHEVLGHCADVGLPGYLHHRVGLRPTKQLNVLFFAGDY